MARRGFMPESEVIKAPPEPTERLCDSCKLYKKCTTPKMPHYGKGKKKILVVLDHPTSIEDEDGHWLAGPTDDKPLKVALSRADIDPLKDCWFAGALACYPKKTNVSAEHVNACRPGMKDLIAELQPEIIIPMGTRAIQSIIPLFWSMELKMPSRWEDWLIPSIDLNAWICPTLSPHHVHTARKRSKKGTETLRQMLLTYYTQSIKRIAEKVGDTPWPETSKTADIERKEVDIILSEDEAVGRINRVRKRGWTLAFDYETTCLNPKIEGAEIVSCSIAAAMGKKKIDTFAYPWLPKTAKATKRLLLAPNKKVASNAKFEEKWTQEMLGIRVRGWEWDTMTAAHVIDNRKDITSIKFQSMVILGRSDYNKHIEPYLRSNRPNELNQIKDLPLRELLLYNGIDSLRELLVARVQHKLITGRRLK